MNRFFVDKDISVAQTISTDIYHSEETYKELIEKIFACTWQFAMDDSRLQIKNDCEPFTLLPDSLDETLVLINNEKGMACFSNVCTHRGKILVEHSCNASHLKCKYHGRMFDLDGNVRSMPEFREVKNYPSQKDNLTQLPLFKWEQFLFTNLGSAPDANLFFGDMISRIDWLPLREFIFDESLSRTYEVKANWALYCENYLEGFHIPFVHEGLNKELDFSNYNTEIFFPYSNLQLGLSKSGRDCFDIPAGHPDHGRNISAYYFWIFPNMMFNFYPWGLSVNIVEPVTVSTTRVRFLSYVWDRSKLTAGAGAELDKVELEDEEIVESVQKGVRSRFYNHGRYSVTKETGTHHFHCLLSNYLSK